MKQYHDLLQHILDNGEKRGDRTGTGTLSVFGYQMRYDLTKGFPAITTKKLYWNGVVTELLWFLKGDTNIKYLNDNNVKIWDAWADRNGNLGPVYGKQWRAWERSPQPDNRNRRVNNWCDCSGPEHAPTCAQYIKPHKPNIDQIANVIQSLREDPESRRHIVSAWNVADLDKMALVPCHMTMQFYVRQGKDHDYLDCQLYQRSADCFLGVPFNVASYALLTHMIAQVCDLKAGTFIHTFGDAHIYLNHIDQVKEQLSRDVNKYALPVLHLNPHVADIDNFFHYDITLIDYSSYPTIKAPLAV